MNKKLQHTTQIVQSSLKLRQLVQHANQLSHLQTILHQQVSAALQEQILLGDYSNGVLTILVRDAVWLTRLRFQQNALLNNLAAYDEFADLKYIQYKVSQPSRPVSIQRKNTANLSATARSHILQLAETIEDPELSQALTRLTRKQDS